jgi:hypothetical protein
MNPVQMILVQTNEMVETLMLLLVVSEVLYGCRSLKGCSYYEDTLFREMENTLVAA